MDELDIIISKEKLFDYNYIYNQTVKKQSELYNRSVCLDPLDYQKHKTSFSDHIDYNKPLKALINFLNNIEPKIKIYYSSDNIIRANRDLTKQMYDTTYYLSQHYC